MKQVRFAEPVASIFSSSISYALHLPLYSLIFFSFLYMCPFAFIIRPFFSYPNSQKIVWLIYWSSRCTPSWASAFFSCTFPNALFSYQPIFPKYSLRVSSCLFWLSYVICLSLHPFLPLSHFSCHMTTFLEGIDVTDLPYHLDTMKTWSNFKWLLLATISCILSNMHNRLLASTCIQIFPVFLT